MPQQRTWLLFIVFTLLAAGAQWHQAQETIAQLKMTQQSETAQRQAELNARIAAADAMQNEAAKRLSDANQCLQAARSAIDRSTRLQAETDRILAETGKILEDTDKIFRIPDPSQCHRLLHLCEVQVTLARLNLQPTTPVP